MRDRTQFGRSRGSDTRIVLAARILRSHRARQRTIAAALLWDFNVGAL